MKTIGLKDGRDIVLREMTKNTIIPCGKGRCPENSRMVLDGDLEPTANFRILNEIMIEKYGTTAILALDGNLVVGFVNFHPTWCPHFDVCQDAQIDEAMTHLDEIKNPPRHEDPALHIRCLMVLPEYRGNRLSIELLDYLKNWAAGRGWKKIVANGNVFSGRAQYQWLVSPKPPKPIWEKAGFVAENYLPLSLSAVSGEESARRTFDWYKSDDYPKDLPRDIAADESNWREIFTDYTMVCKL